MARHKDVPKKRRAGRKAVPARRKAIAHNASKKSTGANTEEVCQTTSQASPNPVMQSRLNPLLVPNEDAEKLNELTLSYYEHIRPANAAEASLVDLLIASIWRGARLVAYEAELLTNKAEDLQPTLADAYESISSTRLFALAFEAINGGSPKGGNGSANPMINRYLATNRNAYHSALSDIERLRKAKGDPNQPYYPPSLARVAPVIELVFPEPEPDPDPVPEIFDVPQPQPEPEKATECPEPAANVPPKPEPVATPKTTKPDVQALISRSVPNPDAPEDPFTVWVHILGPNGRPIVDNYDNPILKPVYIGPEKPEQQSQEAPAPSKFPTAPAKDREPPKKGVVTLNNPFGLDISGGNFRTGN